MSKPIFTRWLGLGLVSLIVVLSMSLYWGFNLLLGVTLLILVQGLLISLCEQVITAAATDGEQKGYIFPLFQSVTVVLFTLVFYLISQAAYTEKVNYLYWLLHPAQNKQTIIEFEIATYICMHYSLVTMILYRKPFSKMIRSQIDKWLPPEWILVLSILLIVHTRVGFSQFIKTASLITGAAILIIMVLMKKAEQKVYKIRYMFEPRPYLFTFTFIVLILWAVGTNMPRVQELPGTRWLKSLTVNLGTKGGLKDNLPVKSELTKDLVLSDAILFEVDTNEPIHLRELAYKNYINNTWELEVGEDSYESYIDFKPAYLEAEYSQTTTILNEMAWIRRQNPELFTEYKEILNRESSITMKKQYIINQNPINKINYFTINGFYEIKDSLATRIYYYGNLENIYLHSNRLIEPTWYQVSYYDRTPKMGSREYTFLKGLSHKRFLWLDKEMKEYRRQGLYNPELIPKLLKTYTPMIQYQKARDNYLQIPDDIKDSIYSLTKQVIKGEVSDWGQAEAICNYLKENYIYNLQSKPNEHGDDVYDFLFNQKQGVCQDFASSMVLMCRSVEIPARYVTGYRVSQKKAGTTNTYIVREKDAHAFVEIYIPAYGWMLFDPTPAEAAREDLETVKREEVLETDYRQLGLGIVILGLGIFLFFRFLEEIRKVYWRILLHLKPTKWGIESLMRKTLLYLEQKGFPKEEKETINQYGKRMVDEGIDIESVVALFEKSTFGHASPTRQELKLALKAYKRLIKNESQTKKSARNGLDRIH